MSVLAIAVGNKWCGDDAAGSAMALGLDDLLPGIEIMETDELADEHARRVSKADFVVFLDVSGDGAPGEVRHRPVAPRLAACNVPRALLPEEILGLSATHFGRTPPAVLVTITGKEFAVGRGLSPEVKRSVPDAQERVRDLAAPWCPGALATLMPGY